MGHDVCPIGKHNLDMRSQEALATDISKRFKASVEYGYYDIFGYDLEGNDREPTFKNVVFGKIIHPVTNKTLWLSDEFYQVHKLIERHGDKAYELPCISKHQCNKLEMDDAINGSNYELWNNIEKEEIGIIYNDVFQDMYHSFDGRWWLFCLAFTEEDSTGRLMENVVSYRNDIMRLYEIIGSDAVYYVDDQGKTQHLAESFYNWEVILNDLRTNYKDTTLHISEFMKQDNRLTRNELPLTFYDDFADIKTGCKNKLSL